MRSRAARSLAAFCRDRRGASAVEFSIVSLPMILTLLMVLQMGLYYMTQSSLDTGVIQAADSLVNTYYSGTAPNITAASLKTLVLAKSGGLVRNDATMLVDFRQIATLAAGRVPIGNIADAPSPNTVYVLRAQASVVTFMPGFAAFAVVRSSALVREQGQ